MVRARGLSRRFGSFTAVDGVDLSVARGEVFGLIGANGAGKTTVIRMLCGMLRPSAGSIHVAGIDSVAHPRLARGSIGYVSQGFALYGDLSVRENLELQAGLYGLDRGAARQRTARALDHLALADLAPHLARTLPLGYQRRLSLACALLHDPPVLLLDEPTSGVDPLARQRLWELIYRLAENGIGVLVTTHYMDEAAFCDQLALMNAGRIMASDTPDKLLAMPLDSTIIEIAVSDAHGHDCMKLLAASPLVQELIPRAGGLRACLRAGTDPAEFMRRVRAEIRDQGLKLTKLEIAPPGLEDVFVSLLEHPEDAR